MERPSRFTIETNGRFQKQKEELMEASHVSHSNLVTAWTFPRLSVDPLVQ